MLRYRTVDVALYQRRVETSISTWSSSRSVQSQSPGQRADGLCTRRAPTARARATSGLSRTRSSDALIMETDLLPRTGAGWSRPRTPSRPGAAARRVRGGQLVYRDLTGSLPGTFSEPSEQLPNVLRLPESWMFRTCGSARSVRHDSISSSASADVADPVTDNADHLHRDPVRAGSGRSNSWCDSMQKHGGSGEASSGPRGCLYRGASGIDAERLKELRALYASTSRRRYGSRDDEELPDVRLFGTATTPNRSVLELIVRAPAGVDQSRPVDVLHRLR